MSISKPFPQPEQANSADPSTLALYSPEGFNPLAVLPSDLHRYENEVRWLIHTLYLRRVLDRRQTAHFIELKAQYLRRVLPHRGYTKILSALESAGTLVIDRHYVEGEKCRGYRLNDHLIDQQHRRTEIHDPSLAEKLRRLKKSVGTVPELDVHRHLYKHLQHVRIDVDLAYLASFNSAIRLSVQAIQDQHWHFVCCDYGRVHTNLTSLDHRLRSSLFVGGSQLVNLDIRNSQPLFLSVVLLNYFLNGGKLDSIHGFNIDEEKQEMYDKLFSDIHFPNKNKTNPSQSPTPLRCAVASNRLLEHLPLPDDVRDYVSLTEQGRLYDELMREWDIPATQRTEFKRDFFGQVLFCRNHERYDTGKRFEAQFPNVTKVLKELKRRDYRQASCLMQRYESGVMINRVVRSVMEQFPDAFVATIHDSILCQPEFADEFTRIMRQEFARVGLRPTINRETYSESHQLRACG